MEMVNDAGQPA